MIVAVLKNILDIDLSTVLEARRVDDCEIVFETLAHKIQFMFVNSARSKRPHILVEVGKIPTEWTLLTYEPVQKAH